MRDLDLGRLVRALRRRRGWGQEDCARRARVDRSTWSNLERGRIDRMALATVRLCLAVLEVRIDLVPRWHGSQLPRLLDEWHATLQAAWKARLERWGWVVRVEASFNRFGDRGRVDLLAWHPAMRIIVVVEIKTEIADVQELLGGLDVKRRVAPHLARSMGMASHARGRADAARCGRLDHPGSAPSIRFAVRRIRAARPRGGALAAPTGRAGGWAAGVLSLAICEWWSG